MIRAIYNILSFLTITCYGLPITDDVSFTLKPKPDSILPQPDEEVDTNQEAFEFDMVLTDLQKYEIGHEIKMRHQFHGLFNGYKRKMLANGIYKWPSGIIPYVIHPGLNKSMVHNIYTAIQEWHTKTCLQFVTNSPEVTRRLGHLDYVLIHPQDIGCSANVGRIGNGQQYANISGSCGTGSIIHELGHVIGFVHEQSRPDRDENVNVIYKNIQHNKIPQFEKYSRRDVNSYDIPYDVGSIMHYGSLAFSKAVKLNLRTIQTNDQKIQTWMGQRYHLSFLDAKLANVAYRCNDHCQTSQNCKNGGYIGPLCTCLCPDGLTGPTCENVVLSQSGCGGIHSELNGIIQSSNYPNNYNYDEDCFWFIKGPENSTVHLTFLDFTTEYDTNCGYDFLEVRVYGAYKVGQRYCGMETGRTLIHNSNSLLLHFKSDSGFSFKGFRISYRIVA